MTTHRTFIGIGSNLNKPLQQVEAAVVALKTLAANGHQVTCSSWYESEALGGPSEQPNYINGVAELRTELSPTALLEQLQIIEAKQHRVRELRWGPRTIDLDILLFDEQTIHTETLKVPHPEMTHRDFVLHPLAELVPNLKLPNGKTVKQLIKELPHTNNLRKL